MKCPAASELESAAKTETRLLKGLGRIATDRQVIPWVPATRYLSWLFESQDFFYHGHGWCVSFEVVLLFVL